MKELWLDTSMLRRWNLRLDTAEADKFFNFCEEWELRILLPEVVLSELVQHYVREATAKLQAVDRSIRDVAALEIPVAEGPVARPPADLTSHYRKLLERRCAERSITIFPVVEVPTERLLDMSVRRIPPFSGDKGERGLHDVLLVFSMLEYARQNKRDRLDLISGDRIFRDESVQALATRAGVRLSVHESVDAFIAHLNRPSSFPGERW